MRSLTRVTAIAAALLGGLASGGPSQPGPRPAPGLDPAHAGSGNKARLLERYQRRQARIAKRSGDHG